MRTVRTIEWAPVKRGQLIPGAVRLVDQTQLPVRLAFITTQDIRVIWRAIKTLPVRGAPAIGIAAAMGLAAAVQSLRTPSRRSFLSTVDRFAGYLATSRPTAVNLFWALDRMRHAARRFAKLPPEERNAAIVKEAMAIRDEDAAMCRAIGEHGASLLKDGDTILTHCNAGSLATSEFGTALAPIYVSRKQGKRISVFADETRPLLQGARLTAWELKQAGIEVTLICDNMAAQVMKEGRIDAVLIGADRIAANGDAANKIGSYGVAVLARAHGIPFYVLAPTSTFDIKTSTGSGIPIEERSAEEVTNGFGRRTAPRGIKVYSPAFDVTPARLISAIICEKGIILPSEFKRKLRRYASEGIRPTV